MKKQREKMGGWGVKKMRDESEGVDTWEGEVWHKRKVKENKIIIKIKI